MIPPPEDLTPIESESPSILGRIGQRTANLPSGIANSLFSLLYNVGIKNPDQKKPEEVPTVYDIPEAKTGGEMAVDIGATLAESLPLFMSGEGAGAGVANLAKLGPTLRSVLRVGTGFGLEGLSRSPEEAAIGTGLGAGFGAAEKLPGKAKYLAAGAVALGSGLHAKHTGASDTTAVVSGAAQGLLPLITRMFSRNKSKVAPEPEVIEPYGPFKPEGPFLEDILNSTTPGYGPAIGLRELKRGTGPAPEGSLIRHPTYTEGEALTIANFERASKEHGPFLEPGYGPRIGLNDKSFELQIQRQPPEGALIREPIFSEGEALRVAEAQQKPLTQMLRLTNEEELPFVTNANGAAEPSLRTVPTTEQPFLSLGAPEGSLIREPTYSQGEIETLLASRTPAKGKIVPFKQTEESLDEQLTRLEKESKDLQAENAFLTELDEAISKIPPNSPRELERVANEIALKHGKKVATLQPPTKPANRLLLSTVFTPENETLANAAAKKLGLEYKGFWPDGGLVEFKIPETLDHPAGGANLSLLAGVAYKDLKNHVRKKIKAFEDQPPKEWLEKKGLGQFQGASIDSLIKDGYLKRQGKELKNTGKVATLQPPSAKAGPGAEPGSAAASIPSPLETPLPQGLKVGDIASFKYEGERTVGKIEGPGELEGTVRIRTSKNEVLDRPASELSLPGVRPETGGLEKSVGGLEDIEKLGTEAQKGFLKTGGGKMRLSNFGEHGQITPELAGALTRYVGFPVVGAAGGYALDEQHRPQSAIMGALAMGLGAHFGWKGLKALFEARPLTKELPKDVPKVIKDEMEFSLRDLWKAVTGNEAMAAKAASHHSSASNIEKIARWINKNTRGRLDTIRMKDAAYGIAENLANTVNTAIENLKNIKDIDQHKKYLKQYFEGLSSDGKTKFSFAELEARVPEEVAQHAAAAVQGITQLQKIILESMGTGKLATSIKQSLGEYLTTTYRIFHEKGYKPTVKQVEAAAESWDKLFPGTDLQTRIGFVDEYLAKIAANRKIMGGVFSGEGGEGLGTILTKTNEKLTPAFKEMLGIYDDPLQRMGFTAIKLVNGARSAEYFNQVSRGIKANGLKYSYASSEKEALIATLQHQMKNGATAEIRETARLKHDELRNYVYNSAGLSSGKLSGTWMDVKARDDIAQYDAVLREFQSPLARSLAAVTNQIKYNKLILNPLQVTRQVVQIPVLGMISRTSPMDWARGFKALQNPAERSRLQQLGILSGDPVGGMLRRDVRAMLDGTIEGAISQRISKRLHSWEEIWRTPDLTIRAATFLKQEAKNLANGMGKVEAANKAIDFTNRYTMNYGAVPPIIAKGRQMPFLNQYLSWTYETLRITKNLVQDAKGGDLYAMGVLGTLASMPFFIQQMTESLLSSEDKKEWDKVKNLGPEYSRYNFKFVQERLPNGDFRYIDFTPLVIHEQFMRMVRSSMAGDVAGVLSSNPLFGWENTPILNIAATQVTGRNRYTGEKLHSIADRAGSTWKDVAPPLLSTELDRLQKSLTLNEQGERGVMNLRSGQTNSISDILQTYLTAVRPYTLRPEYVIRQTEAETRDQIRSQQLVLRRVLNSNAAPEVKQRAREQYEEAKDEIVKAFQDKLGLKPRPELPE